MLCTLLNNAIDLEALRWHVLSALSIDPSAFSVIFPPPADILRAGHARATLFITCEVMLFVIAVEGEDARFPCEYIALTETIERTFGMKPCDGNGSQRRPQPNEL